MDCYVITSDRLKAGAIVECEPVGLLLQDEDGEVDHKVLAGIQACVSAWAQSCPAKQRCSTFRNPTGISPAWDPLPPTGSATKSVVQAVGSLGKHQGQALGQAPRTGRGSAVPLSYPLDGSKHLSMVKPMDIMRKLTQQRLTNARKPTGRFGRLLIRAMNISHYRLTNWGLSHLSIRKQDTILDIGCGGGGTIHKLAKIATNGKVYGIDFSDESVMVSRMTNKQFVQKGRVEIQQSSVSRLPFSDNMFDLVTAVNTHNYWPDLVTDMQEILRVLKPNGKLIIIGSVYTGGKYDKRNQKYAELIEIAFPSVNELRDLFLRAGYSEVQMFEDYDWGRTCGIGRKPCSYF